MFCGLGWICLYYIGKLDTWLFPHMKNPITGQELAFHWFEYGAAQIKLSPMALGP